MPDPEPQAHFERKSDQKCVPDVANFSLRAIEEKQSLFLWYIGRSLLRRKNICYFLHSNNVLAFEENVSYIRTLFFCSKKVFLHCEDLFLF